LLYIEEVHDSGYFHLYARPVFVGKRPSDLRRIDEGATLSIPHDQIRNCTDGFSDELPSGLYVNNLRVTSQGSTDKRDRGLYGIGVEYSQPHSVDLETARKMAATLTRIENRLDKLIEKYGRTSSYSGFVLRVADAIGATRIVFPGRARGSQWGYDGLEHSICELADGAARLDGIVRRWQEAETTAVA
jgi:hypothetical protein